MIDMGADEETRYNLSVNLPSELSMEFELLLKEAEKRGVPASKSTVTREALKRFLPIFKKRIDEMGGVGKC